MREILFRGQCYTGEWVEGQYYKRTHYYSDPSVKHYIIVSTEALDYDQALEYHEVFPETVGQYVGLKDRDGTKIFEGDICDMSILGPDHVLTEIVVLNGCVGFIPLDFNAVHPDDRKWRCFWNNDEDDLWPGEYFTVIGNIHDNPELLEAK